MRCLYPIFGVDLGINKETGKHKISFSPKYGIGLFPLPCGKCVACRANKVREWRIRMLLEASLYSFSSFLTLTYNDKSLPKDRLLSRSHIQCFIKKLRNATRDYGVVLPPSVRYFVAGEYGKLHHRPHYHGVIFGVDFTSDEWLPTLVGYKDGYPVFSSGIISRIWSFGFNTVDVVTPSNIRYVAKYVSKDDVDGRPFYLSSIGLGRSLFADVSRHGRTYDYRFKDVFFDRFPDGRLCLYSGGDSYFVKTPKFLDRYAERFFPDLYQRVKNSRRDFVKHSPNDLRPSSMRERDINYCIEKQLKERKLDNET